MDDISQSNFIAHSTIWREISRSRRDKKDGGEKIIALNKYLFYACTRLISHVQSTRLKHKAVSSAFIMLSML